MNRYIRLMNQKNRHYEIFRLLIMTMVIGMLASCSNYRVKDKLKIADKVIESRPDSSLKLLRSIDSKDLGSHFNSAYFTLLYYQARYKCEEPIDSDSALMVASDYFRQSNNRRLLGRALYYIADRNYDEGELRKSIYNCREAYEISKETGDPLLRARTSDLLGLIYNQVHNYTKAAELHYEAAEYFGIAGKPENRLFSLCDYANAISKDHPGKAKTILDSILNIAIATKDSKLNSYASNFLLPFRLEDNRMQDVNEYLANERDYKISGTGQNDSIYLALHYLNTGEMKKAKTVLDEISKNNLDMADENELMVCYATYYYGIGDYKNSTEFLDSARRIRNRHLRDIYMQSVYDVENDFYARKTEMERMHNRDLRIINAISIVAVFVTFLLVLVIILLKKKREKERFELRLLEYKLQADQNLEQYEEETNNLNSSLIESHKELNELRGRIEKLFIDKARIVGNLYQKYYSSKKQGALAVGRIKEIENELESLLGKEDRMQLYGELNFYLNGQLDILGERIPKLTEEDLLLYGLSVSQFGIKAIAFYLGVSSDTIYKRRLRLKKKIEESNIENKEAYLKNLS